MDEPVPEKGHRTVTVDTQQGEDTGLSDEKRMTRTVHLEQQNYLFCSWTVFWIKC